jgi:hypothetical protein
MTICEKFYTDKLPDKQKLDKKEPSESSRVDEWPRDLPNHWKASPMMKNQQQKFKKVKS